jgi:integrase
MHGKPQHTVELADGRRIRFSIKNRPNEPFYFVVFRGIDGHRLERSTKETSQKRALEEAVTIIRDEYAHRPVETPSWDVVTPALRKAMEANNNRPSTVDDYENALQLLRSFFPLSSGPGDITPQLAKQFKAEYLAQKYVRRKKREPKVWKGRGRKPKPRPEPVTYSRKARTLDSRLRKLRVIWGRWFIKELGYIAVNPWKDVTPPKLDKLTPRYLTADEVNGFFDWLGERWQGWRLPILFFLVKSFLGCRILELCSLRSDQLQNGRVVFLADEVKGRKERRAILPSEVYGELKALAGPTYVWQAFPSQLLERLKMFSRPHANLRPDFSPDRLKSWMQGEIADYCKAHPEVKRFSAHAFRKRAMTEAWRLDIPLEKAAVAFGCNPNTMRTHYIAMDELAIADEVLKTIAQVVQPNGGRIEQQEKEGAA